MPLSPPVSPIRRRAKSRLFLLVSMVTGSLSILQFGYNSGIINQPRDAMTQCGTKGPSHNCIPMDNWQWGLFVSAFLVGGACGALAGASLADKYGRRRSLAYNNIAFFAATLAFLHSDTVFGLSLGRFLVGIGSGVGTVVVPIWISELSPPTSRGSWGILSQLMIVIGIFISMCIGIFQSTPTSWRFMLAGTAVPSVLQLIIFPGLVETPKWLSQNGFQTEAQAALNRLHNTSARQSPSIGNRPSFDRDENRSRSSPVRIDSESDLERSQDSLLDQSENVESDAATVTSPQSGSSITFRQLITSSTLRKPLMAGLLLHMAQQFSGINVVIYYSTTIFNISFDPTTAVELTMLVPICNLAATLMCMLLIDRMGRRILLLVSLAGMSFVSFAIAVSSVIGVAPSFLVVILMLFVIFFAFGLGSIPWLMFTELMPPTAIGPAGALGTAVNWGSAFFVALLSPVIISAVRLQSFFIFGCLSSVFFLLTLTRVPETKGKTAEEIAASFRK